MSPILQTDGNVICANIAASCMDRYTSPDCMNSPERRDVFTHIHRTMAWGDHESTSGLGSTRERAATFLPDLIDLVESLCVSTLLDAPCGDFNWTAPLADAVAEYIGVDVVPELIAHCDQRYSSPRRRFLCLDFVEQAVPAADLVFCRDGLVHLSERDIFLALRNFRDSGAKYLLATTFVAERENPDIATGDWRPLNMQRRPYFLPEPLRLIDERCHHTGGIYADKRIGLWRLSDLAFAD